MEIPPVAAAPDSPRIAHPSTSRRQLIEAVIASTVGTTIEWYDFFLYGLVAGMVFDKVFFPTAEPFTGTIYAFATYSIGFLARPLGGVIFGYMGDRVGRKSMLVTTLLLMGISTLAIGFMPTFADIGIAAPILLTSLRFVQGLGVGGEWGGAVLLALEYSPSGRRGFAASWPQAGVPLGLLSSAGVVAICKGQMSESDFIAWGWRIPFYLSALLIVVGLLIRIRIMETPLFAAVLAKKEVAEAPLTETIRGHWRDILLVAGGRITENAAFYLFTATAITYGDRVLGVGSALMLQAVYVSAAIELFTIPLFGWLSDRYPRRKTYLIGCAFLLFFAVPYYALLDTREPIWIMVATISVLCIGHAMLYSVQASLIPELFGTRLRCTGASIGYQLAVPLSGGIAPLVAAFFMKWYPNNYWPLAGYVMVNSVISFACIWYLAETSRKDIGRDQ